MMEFEAVVLAGGKGSRMSELTSCLPKCLLPVGGVPLLWYPLRLLQDAGFSSALLVHSEQLGAEFRAQMAAVPDRHGLQMELRLAAIPGDEDPGTADSLRLLRQREQLSGRGQLLVISCDLLTSCRLGRLVSRHRLEAATLTALLATQQLQLTAVTAPGPKTKYKPERDIVSTSQDSGTGATRLCLLSSEADFEELVPLQLLALQRAPRQQLRRSLLDAHVYLLDAGVLDYVCERPSLASLKGELVPRLLRAQFGRGEPAADLRNPAGVTQPPASPYSTHKLHHFLPRHKYTELIDKLSDHPQHKPRADTVTCYAEMTDELTVRVNTVHAYLAANRSVTRLWAALGDPHPPRIHPSAQIPDRQVRISEDSVVGAGSQLSERCTLQGSVVGAECHLGQRLQVIDSVLMDHVWVGDDCSVTNCILMPHCRVESGAVLKDCLVGSKQLVSAKAHRSREIISLKAGAMDV